MIKSGSYPRTLKVCGNCTHRIVDYMGGGAHKCPCRLEREVNHDSTEYLISKPCPHPIDWHFVDADYPGRNQTSYYRL